MTLAWTVHYREGWSSGDQRAAFADLVGRLLTAGLPPAGVAPPLDQAGPRRYFMHPDPLQLSHARDVATAWIHDHAHGFARVDGPEATP